MSGDERDNSSSSEEEEYTCKICDNTSTNNNDTLITPCACRGTLSYVHHDCLKNWINVSGQTMCLTCGEMYKFKTGLTGFIPERIFQVYNKISLWGHSFKAGVILGIMIYTYFETVHVSLITNPFTNYSLLICLGIKYAQIIILAAGIMLYYMILMRDVSRAITASSATFDKHNYIIDITSAIYFSYILSFHITEATFATYTMGTYLVLLAIDTFFKGLQQYKKRTVNNVILNYSQ